jgi:hypothetical protein
MLTNVQGLINELTTYQIPEGYKLGGKGPAMKKLAGTIKEIFPSLSDADKGIFLATVGRGRFAINKDIWAMFCEAVGIEAPAPTPAPAPAQVPATTNKVAGEILELCTGINLNQVKDHQALVNVGDKLQTMNGMILSLINTVSDLRKQVAELHKTATPRRGARAKVEDCIELEAV